MRTYVSASFRFNITLQQLSQATTTFNNTPNNEVTDNMAFLIKIVIEFKFNRKLKQHDRRHKRWLRSYGEKLPEASQPKATQPALDWVGDKLYFADEDLSEANVSKLSFEPT